VPALGLAQLVGMSVLPVEPLLECLEACTIALPRMPIDFSLVDKEGSSVMHQSVRKQLAQLWLSDRRRLMDCSLTAVLLSLMRRSKSRSSYSSKDTAIEIVKAFHSAIGSRRLLRNVDLFAENDAGETPLMLLADEYPADSTASGSNRVAQPPCTAACNR
jgi:hypothetical protein